MKKLLENEKLINLVKKLALVGLMLLIFASMFILNHSVCMSPDDYNYSGVIGQIHNKVDTLEDCITSATYLYNNWTGRVIPHLLIGLTRNLNPYVYECLNTLIFMCLIIIINKIISGKVTFFGTLAAFGYFVFSMMFGEKFAWISGTFNYLWPTTAFAVLAYFIYRNINEEFEINLAGKIALVLWAFITGFSHENIAFVGGAFLGCLYLFNIKKLLKVEIKEKIFYILLFISFCAGAFLTIFAPGNMSRMGQENTSFNWGFLGNYFNAKYHLIICLITMVIMWFKDGKDLVKKELLFFFVPLIIATIPMGVIANFPPRAFLPYEFLIASVMVGNIILLLEKVEKYNIALAILSVVFTLVVFRRFSPSTLAQIRYIIPYKEELTRELNEAKEKGEKDVLVLSFDYLNYIHREDYINIDNFFVDWNCTMPVNVFTAMYYDFDKVTAIGKDNYMIEIEVDTEGINPYFVIDKETGIQTDMMECDNWIRFQIPKDKFGKYVLNCQVNDVEDLVKSYKVRSIEGEKLKDTYSIDDLIIK